MELVQWRDCLFTQRPSVHIMWLMREVETGQGAVAGPEMKGELLHGREKQAKEGES